MEEFVRQCGTNWAYCDSDCGHCSDNWSRALASAGVMIGVDLGRELRCEENFPKNSARPLTNADKIRKMSDEELAHLFVEDYWGCIECSGAVKCDGNCEAHCLNWLREVAK